MQEIILKVRYFERELPKSLKKGNLIFSFELSLSVDKIIKNKRGLELLISRYLGSETSSEKTLYYVLSDQV